MQPEDEPLWTSQQCADFLGVTEGALRKWRMRGQPALPFAKVGRTIRYVPAVVRQWVRTQLD